MNNRSFIADDTRFEWECAISDMAGDVDKIEEKYQELICSEEPEKFSYVLDTVIKEAKEEFEKRLRYLEGLKPAWSEAIVGRRK